METDIQSQPCESCGMSVRSCAECGDPLPCACFRRSDVCIQCELGQENSEASLADEATIKKAKEQAAPESDEILKEPEAKEEGGDIADKKETPIVASLEGRKIEGPEDIPEFRAVLADAKRIGQLIKVVAEFQDNTTFTVDQDRGFMLGGMDPANVAMLGLRIFPSAFIEWQIESPGMGNINLGDLKKVLKRAKKHHSLELRTEKKNDSSQVNLVVCLVGAARREVSLMVSKEEGPAQKWPALKFTASAMMSTAVLRDEIEALGDHGESVRISPGERELILTTLQDDKDTDPARTLIPVSDPGQVQGSGMGKYSHDYLNKFLKAVQPCGNEITLSWGEDYPLMLEVVGIDKWSLRILLAPRVDND